MISMMVEPTGNDVWLYSSQWALSLSKVEKAKIGPPPECPCKDLKCPRKPKKEKKEEKKEDLGPCAMKSKDDFLDDRHNLFRSRSNCQKIQYESKSPWSSRPGNGLFTMKAKCHTLSKLSESSLLSFSVLPEAIWMSWGRSLRFDSRRMRSVRM